MTPGVGPRVAAKLLERFGSAEGTFGAMRGELERLRLRPETIESIVFKRCHEAAERELEQVRTLGVEVLVLDDGAYPALLRETPDPPLVLYARGEWAACLEAPCVAVVGSRRCSTYGQNAATMLARELAARGVTIVSGLAHGIDAAAHRGALDASGETMTDDSGKVLSGRTVAVMGTGLDDVYPRDHNYLAEQIVAAGGALISEFPLGTPPAPQNFPYRNRVISGLSLGVVLVEAAENSGSLITARLALEQSREVFAVPGNVTSKKSFGTNYLIKGAGAKLVQTWQDVVVEFPPEVAARILPPAAHRFSPQMAANRAPDDLSTNGKMIFDLLSADDPVHIDRLVETSALSIPELTNALLELELRELVRQLPGRCFVRKL